MSMNAISTQDVLLAVEEFDRSGRDAFLAEYGFVESRDYFLVLNDRRYDSKAIVGVAHKYRDGEPLRPADFSGGEATVGKFLRGLGFEVMRNKQLNWTRDELILVCDLVRSNGWKEVKAYDPRAKRLSELLQVVSPYPVGDRGPSFRNPNSVQLKSGNIATVHPDYAMKQSRGGALDRAVLEEFLRQPEEMTAYAAALREAASSRDAGAVVPDPDLESAIEGGLLERRHILRERDPRLRLEKIRQVQERSGTVGCEACGFDFEDTYGRRGQAYIECHHTVPLSATGVTVTNLDDLALLCSNCHRMIHVRRPWLTISQLRELIRR